ncbi:hypothetical protein HMPREF1139_0923 [Campylobacter sp. FOBRC14]|nr:hypothetical protein HMPREF1139_0923 [Campylobacter sp. FOBRC14]
MLSSCVNLKSALSLNEHFPNLARFIKGRYFAGRTRPLCFAASQCDLVANA